MIYINKTKVKKYAMTGTLALIALFLGFKTAGNTTASYNAKLTCSMFSSQKVAQDYFKKDSKKYGYLDRDKDGIPCEALQ